MRKEDKMRLERNDQATKAWICGVKHSDRLSGDSLYNRLGIDPLSTILRLRRLRWFAHVSRNEGWISHCLRLDVVGKCRKGRPPKTWEDAIQDNLKFGKINNEYNMDRVILRCAEASPAQVSNPCFKERRR